MDSQTAQIEELEAQRSADDRYIARLKDIILEEQSKFASVKRQLDALRIAFDRLQEQLAASNLKLRLPLTFARRLKEHVEYYHHLGAYVWEAKTRSMIGTVSGFLGLHPLDIVPAIGRQHYTVDGEILLTWSFNQSYGNEKLYRTMFDFTMTDNVGLMEHPMLTFPDFIGRAYDKDPPDPGWHNSGIAQQLYYHRTSVFEPHYSTQNDMCVAVLDRWWDRIKFVVTSLDELVQWAGEV